MGPDTPPPPQPASPAADEPRQRASARRRALLVAGLILAILAALLCCLWPRPALPFDWFRDRAERLERDPERVLAFVRDEVLTLDYRGDVKGALGALWEGAASPEEKQALAAAILAHCRGGARAPDTAALAPGAAPPAAGEDRRYTLTLIHRALLAQGAPRETAVWSGPIGALVGDVHSLRVLEEGTSLIEVRADPPAMVRAQTADAEGEELLFRIERPGAAEPLEVVRELWRRGNRVGLDAARPGDRHAFVVWPCRIGAEVREKEELRLREAGRRETPLGDDYLRLLDFARAADELLVRDEAQLGVRARFDLPRVLFLSTIEHQGRTARALDLRQDGLSFTGATGPARRAAEARGYQEAMLEQKFLQDTCGETATSAWQLFRCLDETRPDTPARRLRLAGQALGRLLTDPTWRQVRFARAGLPEGGVSATRTEAGALRLAGAPIAAELAGRLSAAEGLGLRWESDGRLELELPAAELAQAALAVEVTLLSQGATPLDYALQVEVQRDDPLVQTGASFRFEADPQAGRWHEVRVEDAQDGLLLSYAVRDGLQVVKGTRKLPAEALAQAARHNPHYGRGADEQPDATSFCLSRAVFARLQAGERVPLTLLQALAPGETERVVAQEVALEPRGAAEVRCQVNGRETALPALRVAMGEQELLVLADPRFPVGRAEQLTEVRTGVRARLVDAEGLGWSGVQVEVGRAQLVTDPDGGFLIPAGAPGVEDLAHARCVITRTSPAGGPPLSLGELELDLRAPGLDVLTLTLPRLPADVRLIAPEAAAELEPLAVSEQVKRHARRALAGGHTVAIPARMVDTGAGEQVAFFAHDPRSGHVVGVTEDGLHGASGGWEGLRNEIQAELTSRLWEARSELKDGVHPIHMIRGFVVAFGVYAIYRLKGLDHDQIIARMLEEMEDWEKRTSIFEGVPEQLAGTEAAETASHVGNTNGPLSFYLGYLGALRFLHEQLGR